nr:SPFH domain-containing protein [Streptomyces sp. RLB3-6]
MAIRIVRQYEQGVLFRFGRLVGPRAPGLRFIIPFVDVLHRVSLRSSRCRSSRRASSPATTSASTSLLWPTSAWSTRSSRSSRSRT